MAVSEAALGCMLLGNFAEGGFLVESSTRLGGVGRETGKKRDWEGLGEVKGLLWSVPHWEVTIFKACY